MHVTIEKTSSYTISLGLTKNCEIYIKYGQVSAWIEIEFTLKYSLIHLLEVQLF